MSTIPTAPSPFAAWMARALELAENMGRAMAAHDGEGRALVAYTRTRDSVQAARAALALHLAEVPMDEMDGWKMLPVAPTPEMVDAFADNLEGACGSFFDWSRGGDEAYAAMVSAAPLYRHPKEQ